MRRTWALAAAVLAVAGCGGEGAADRSAGISGRLTVLAASSLAEPFTALGRAFEADHPDVTVTFNFAASSSVARQLVEGAPGDVLATADEATMGVAVDAGAVSAPAVFARNRLEIVTRPGNPEGIAGLADLARPGLVVVLCAPGVPCGRAATQALDRVGVDIRPASSEENVKAVLAKVALGEADAGIVYVTDVRAAGADVTGVAIPDADNVVTDYPLAVSNTAPNPPAARAWFDLVVGPAGRDVLARYGFLPSPP